MYSRENTTPNFHSIIGEALAQKALQAATFTTTALAAASTSIAGSGISGQSSTTGPEISPGYSTGTVHWQSAFWALVAIALNTCLQDSRAICEIKPKYGLLVKSSPVFCAVDAVIVWCQTLYYLTRVPPREALRIVARSRQQHGPDTQEESGSVSISVVVARWLLLVFAVLQGLKLYALRGIPWTQVFGTMYLVSYATNAILNVMGRPQRNEGPDMRRGDIRPSVLLVHRFAMIATCLQIGIWTTTIRGALSDDWLAKLARTNCRWPANFATGVFLSPLYMCWYIAMIGVILVDFATILLPPVVVLLAMDALVCKFLPSIPGIVAGGFGCGVKAMRYTFASLFTAIAVAIETCFLGAFQLTSFILAKNSVSPFFRPFGYFIHNWATYRPYGFALLALCFTAVLSHILYRLLCMGSMARKLKATSLGLSSNLAWACIFMFSTNVSLSLLYYSFVYTPEGTSKPSWTDNLGRKFV